MAGSSTTATTSTGARLRRALTLWDLILYGVIVIQPVAPMSVFGVLSNRGRGHVATTILIAMVAMLFTAISYGRMARAYPSAGSAFTYVGQEINPALGYITGWSMAMDYMLNPIICVIWCSQQAHVFASHVPYWAWAIFFAAIFTVLNVQGVKTSARVNAGLAAGMGVVIAIFFVAAARYLLGQPHAGGAFFIRPFYDPQTWNAKAVLGGTSIAVLTYIGFDGISTLSEEAENPRRNILLATVLTCFVIGILSAVEVYAAQLVWPASQPYPNLDTAFTFVAQRAWAPLFVIVGFTLVVANFGSGMGAQLGAARLLYGMGRSSALPKGFFGAVDPKRHIPRNNVLFVGGLALLGAFLLPALAGEATGYELGTNLLNFGALLAFMGVNLAAFVRYFLRASKKTMWNFLPPVLGFVICAVLWWNLSSKARIFGAIWMLAGIGLGAWKTRGFRANLINFELPADEQEV
ncbi:MAG: APC family permease [Acidobacteria bacterium]|nr:APC family permease [Acidobacteriota bacterium]MBV9482897.1 APC family permease [Acidobacteriota bacterium]